MDNKRKRAVVISPLRASPERSMHTHELFARRLCRILTRKGYATYAGHVYCVLFLDENVPEDRQAGIETNYAWIEVAEVIFVWDWWGISSGMKAEIEHAQAINMRRIEDTSVGGDPLAVPLIEIRYASKGEVPEWARLDPVSGEDLAA
jgi:hypothetical protein